MATASVDFGEALLLDLSVDLLRLVVRHTLLSAKVVTVVLEGLHGRAVHWLSFELIGLATTTPWSVVLLHRLRSFILELLKVASIDARIGVHQIRLVISTVVT